MADNGGSNHVDEEFVISEEDLKRFKAAYSHCRGGMYNLDVQVTYLIKLADGYFGRYLTNKNIFDALKAHALYNSIGYRCENDPMWSVKAFEVQQAYWDGDAIQHYEEYLMVNKKLLNELQNIRQNVRANLERPKSEKSKFFAKAEAGKDGVQDREHFCHEMAGICLKCTDQMVKFCELVIEHSLHILNQERPCAFNVIALGSIAKGEATPYSDFEFLFLIEQKDEKIVKYFECLAMTCYFLIGNLRETPLETMEIAELKGWFEDKQKRGFHIDGLKEGAGNIPTSNTSESLNSNIVTPNELLIRYKTVLDEPDGESARRGDLTAMLQYTKVVISQGKLASNLLGEFLLQKRKIPIKESRRKMNRKMFQADAIKYNFRPDMGLIERGYMVIAKKELYRYPSILLYDISILANSHESNSWDTLHSLKEKEIISKSIHQSIFFLLACACYFRLSAYLFHDSCDDRISVLSNEALSTVNLFERHESSKEIGRRWYMPQSLFVRHCEHAVPLKSHIENWRTVEIMRLLQKEIESPNWIVKFQTLHCCHEWTRAWNIFQEKIGQQVLQQNPMEMIASFQSSVGNDFHKLWFCIKALGYVLFQDRKYEEAYGCHKSFYNLLNNGNDTIDSDQMQLILADVLEELGSCSIYRNNHSIAEKEYMQSLEIRLQFLGESHELVGRSKLFIGRCLRLMKRFDEAEKHLLGAARIYHSLASSPTKYDYFGEPIHQQEVELQLDTAVSPDYLLSYMNNSSVMLGHVLWNLGNLYFSLKYYDRAFNYFSATERMYEEAYGDEACHKDISESLLALAFSNDMLGRNDAAHRYWYTGALVITRLYGKNLLPSLLKVADQLGTKVYCKLIVETFCQLRGYKVGHVESAGIGRFFSLHLIRIGYHDLAESLIRDVIDMYKNSIVCDENDEEIAKIISFQGLNFWKWKKYELAKEHFTKALKMLDNNQGQYAKLEAAETLQNMGLMYVQLKEYSQARNCLTQARDRFLSCCQEADHPKVLETMKQLNSLPTLPFQQPISQSRCRQTQLNRFLGHIRPAVP